MEMKKICYQGKQCLKVKWKPRNVGEVPPKPTSYYISHLTKNTWGKGLLEEYKRHQQRVCDDRETRNTRDDVMDEEPAPHKKLKVKRTGRNMLFEECIAEKDGRSEKGFFISFTNFQEFFQKHNPRSHPR